MAVSVFKNARVYLGGYDLSGDLNKVSLDYGVDMIDKTPINAVAKSKVAGLFDFGMSMQGFWQAGINPLLIDDILMSKLTLQDEIITVCPQNGGVAGELAYISKVVEAKYSPGGSVGELLAFSVDAQGSEKLIKGVVAETEAKTVTGTGTARNLGLVAAGQRLFVACHVLSVAGTTPTFNLVIESDDLSGFASPVTRLTFTQMNAIGAQWKEIAGPIATDIWFRPCWTIGGTGGPSFTVVIIIGIG